MYTSPRKDIFAMLYITLKHSKKTDLSYLALCWNGIVISFDPRVIKRIAGLPLGELRSNIQNHGDFVVERT